MRFTSIMLRAVAYLLGVFAVIGLAVAIRAGVSIYQSDSSSNFDHHAGLITIIFAFIGFVFVETVALIGVVVANLWDHRDERAVTTPARW